jgi:hypothetical protein
LKEPTTPLLVHNSSAAFDWVTAFTDDDMAVTSPICFSYLLFLFSFCSERKMVQNFCSMAKHHSHNPYRYDFCGLKSKRSGRIESLPNKNKLGGEEYQAN